MKKLYTAVFLVLFGIGIGAMIINPIVVLGQASTGGAGASNEIFLPSLNINDAYSFPTVDGTADQILTTNGSGTLSWNNQQAATTFLGLSDTPSGYTTGNAIYTANGTPNAVIETTVVLTEAANTFNIAKGTASLDIAAGATLNIDTNLTVNTASVTLNQNLASTASPTFNDLTISSPSAIYSLSHDSFADFVADEHVAHTGVTITAGDGITGGGDISATRTLTLGTPTTLTPSTTNGVTASSHTHEVTGFVPEDGVQVKTPSSDQSLLAGSTLSVTDALMRVAGNGGAVTITATPSITNPSSDGTQIIVQGTDDTNTVKFQDESNLTGSDLELKNNQDFTLGKGDILALIWDSGEDAWYELYRSDN